MRALLVIDVQKGLLEQGAFHQEKARIQALIETFKQKEEPVIFMRHTNAIESSPLAAGSDGAEIDPELAEYADYTLEKHTPSSFYNTTLDSLLRSYLVDHVVVTGFNTEFCCQFTAIAAYDRGYKVTFIENATATVNDENNYEMPGLDIRDFVGTVLHWSNVIEVLDFEEYMEG
ncbi:MAG TPA: isochorismatase family protein [Bacillales bacterium]|nr:isochorismatase family protein [Bacillales bacterium]